MEKAEGHWRERNDDQFQATRASLAKAHAAYVDRGASCSGLSGCREDLGKQHSKGPWLGAVACSGAGNINISLGLWVEKEDEW